MKNRTDVRVPVFPNQHMTATDFHGSGEVAVTLHGLPGARGGWSKVVEALPPHMRVVAPDLLGFGSSDPLDPLDHAEHEARAVLRLLEALQVPSFHLVGHDFGGPTALWIYRLARHRVKSLALMATNAFRDTPIPGFLKLAHVPVLGDAMFRVLFGRWGLHMLWLQAVKDRDSYPLREYRQCLESAMGVRSTRALLLRSLRHLDELYREVESVLPTVDVPSLVLWGSDDPFFNVAQVQRLAASLRADFHVLQGCGHFVPQERPRETADHLARLWSVRDARTG